ncbi:sugar efflux transporter [Dactylosporangium fulvum]|uniref:Sugar efflux transporter n=1 Tax=Dactylosporangium fulvum TaxID=53359 RepID=A0ABY5WAS6_9ACTN|nr:sugar efflux transporter [Dactylosporangium fulvum]UWP86445.1 sugar efflux transporter [Dactylosporangium fulvum]
MDSGVRFAARSTVQQTGRALVPLGFMFFFVGLSTAVVGPFVSLFLSTAVRADPVRVAVFLVAGPLSMVVSSTLIGWLSDRRSIRRTLLLTAASAGCAGSILTAFVRDYWVLLALTVTVTAVSGALFPQAFAYAREVLQRRGSTRAAMSISTLRMVFSIAWVAGPPVAALLVELGGFRLLYLTAALTYAVAAVVVLCWLDEVGPAPAPDAAAPPVEPPMEASRLSVLRVVAALALLQGAGVLGIQAMPLFLGHVLHTDVSYAGLVLGLCAALEIPLMLAFGALSTKWPLRPLIVIGAGLGALYYGLVTATTASWQVAALQLLNAGLIAAVGGLSISYVQELLPAQPGRAATLAGNALPLSAIFAGPLLGVAAHFGYRTAYAFGAALCVAGLALLLVSPRLAPAARPQSAAAFRRAH